MRVYRLTPSQDQCRLTPREILERLTSAFALVKSDVDDAEPLWHHVIDAYTRMFDQYDELKQRYSYFPVEPPRLTDVDRTWRNAIHMHVWLDQATDRRFSSIVNNDGPFDIFFSETVSTFERRTVTHDVATIVGYTYEIADTPDCVETDPVDGQSDSRYRKWWRRL